MEIIGEKRKELGEHRGKGEGSREQNKFCVMHEPNRDGEEKPLDTNPLLAVKKAEVAGKNAELA